MKNKIVYVLAVATLAILAFGKVGDFGQAPPEPNCSLDPELCNKK